MAAAVVALMIRMCFSVYHHVIGELPTLVIVGMGAASQTGRTWVVCLRSMPNVFTGSCARNALLPSENLLYRHPEVGHHCCGSGRESNQRWYSDGSGSAAITERDCVSRSRWTAVIVRHCTGRSLPAASTVKQYRTSCWERWNAASANDLPSSPIG